MRLHLGLTSEFWILRPMTDLASGGQCSVSLCHEDLRAVYGATMLENGLPSEMTVCGMGKFGGFDLGFASISIDVHLFGNGQTTGPLVISSANFTKNW